jgi:hypothetical protein
LRQRRRCCRKLRSLRLPRLRALEGFNQTDFALTVPAAAWWHACQAVVNRRWYLTVLAPRQNQGPAFVELMTCPCLSRDEGFGCMLQKAATCLQRKCKCICYRGPPATSANGRKGGAVAMCRARQEGWSRAPHGGAGVRGERERREGFTGDRPAAPC